MEIIVALAVVLFVTIAVFVVGFIGYVFLKIINHKPITAEKAVKIANATSRAQGNCRDILKLAHKAAMQGRYNVVVPHTNLYADLEDVEDELHKLGYSTHNSESKLWVIW